MKEKEEAEENKSEKMGKKVRNTERNLIHIEEDTSIRGYLGSYVLLYN